MTTISIAHRLSTIKRSDTILVLDNTGKVAEEGRYEDLVAKPDGAFMKLMEWQLAGDDTKDTTMMPPQLKGELSEHEIEEELREEGLLDPEPEVEVEEEELKLRERLRELVKKRLGEKLEKLREDKK